MKNSMDGIKNNNKIPGSERLTRPEEISALSKYLGNIRKVQEEHTKLDKTDLEIPGVTTGYIPEIEKLPEDALELGISESSKLSDHIETLDIDRNISLPDESLKISDNRKIELSKELETIDKPGEIGLSNEKDYLTVDNPNLDLSGFIDELDIDSNVALDDRKEQLKDTKNIENLESKVENLDKQKDLDLEETIINLDKQKKLDLEDTVSNLNVENKIENLESKVENLDKQKDLDLEDTVEKIEDIRKPELSDTVDPLTNTDPKFESLYDAGLEMPGTIEDKELEDKTIDLGEIKDTNLEDISLKLDGDIKDLELEDELIENPNSSQEGWNQNLYDDLISMSEDQKYEKMLEMTRPLGLWGNKIASLISSYLSSSSISQSKAEEFEAKLKEIIGIDKEGYLRQQSKSEGYNLVNAKDKSDLDIDSSKDTTSLGELEFTDLFNSHEGNIEKTNGKSSVKIKSSLNEEISDLSEAKIQRLDNDLTARKDGGEMYNKVSGLTESNMPDREKEVILGFNTGGATKDDYGWPVGMPSYHIPSTTVVDAINLNNYLRWAVENTLGLWKPENQAQRKTRQILIDETLAMLVLAREQMEKAARSNRDRLPGDDFGLVSDLVKGGASGVVDSLKNSLIDSAMDAISGKYGVNTKNPINRPLVDVFGKPELTHGFDIANNRTTPELEGKDKLKAIGKSMAERLKSSTIGIFENLNGSTLSRDYKFYDNYLNSYGIATTLSELCGNPSWTGSLEELNDILKNAPYITTPKKFGTIRPGEYNTMTLDSNGYWEIIMTPFVHPVLNGGYSFLPAIQEINLINKANHGVSTAYNGWIPFNSFELQKTRLTTKSLGLYDGEINYPISAEQTNEFRVTIVDDQYKSWKNYFQKCMDVAVYNSEAHTEDWYWYGGYEYTRVLENKYTDIDDYNEARFYPGCTRPTIVDKSQMVVAFYKNITFEFRIFTMTPQYSTIRQFDLLCVLKDFSEEYTGDVDAGGANDLNLIFSIVGENPKGVKNAAIFKSGAGYENLFKQGREDLNLLTKRNNRTSSLIKLL